MEELDLKQFEPYLFLLIGVGIMLFSLLSKNKKSHLKNSGEKVEGIVYELGHESNYKPLFNNSVNVKDKVAIRFVTKKDEWVTGNINQPFAIFFTGQYKAGEKVEVYYDREDPSSFYIDTKQSDKYSRIFIAFIGLVFCFIGLYKIYN